MRFRIDPRRVTLAEFRTEASFPKALLGWLITRLPVKIPSSSEYPAVDKLAPYYLAKEQMPAEVKAVFRDARQELESLGFRGTLYHCIEDPIQRTTIYYASFLHKTGNAIARLKYRIFRLTTPNRTYFCKEFITALRDGSFIITSSSPGDLKSPDSCQVELMPKAPIPELWTRHSDRIADTKMRSSIKQITSAHEVLATLEEQQRQVCESLVARRVFVPVNDESIQAVPAAPVVSTLPASDLLLHSEIDKIQNKPAASWAMSVFLIVASIALFVAAGGVAWSWKFALMLVPILLFHEAGHYVAMKLFDYRNVQMFFIPLLGAAVTGQHFNVPGWKKVVTSLMGPLPGILVGVGLGIIAILRQQQFLLEAAQLMIFINGFNLLPSLPLDGGWVAHGLLFSRHAFLDLIFRMLAIGLLLFAGLVGGGRLLIFIGIAMLVALPVAFRMARITDRLRGSKAINPNAVEGRIPDSAAQSISAEIDREFPKGLDIRAKAKFVLQIFENVNSKPPGWIATFTLGGIYVAGLFTALVAGTVFTVARHADLGQFLVDSALEPKFDLEVNRIIRQPAAANAGSFVAVESLVINFTDRELAASALTQLRNELEPDAPLLLYGNTVVLPLAGEKALERKGELFSRYESAGQEVFVSGEKLPAALRLRAIAPTPEIAQQIERTATAYFQIPSELRLIPPWHSELRISDEQLLARQTVLKLQELNWLFAEGQDDDIYEKMDAARRRGEQGELAKLNTSIRQRRKERRLRRLEELRASADGDVDRLILDRYRESFEQLAADENPDSEAPIPDAAKWLGDLAPRLGQLPGGDTASEGMAARFGSVSANGSMLTIFATFDAIGSGSLSITNWLNQHGCNYYKYEVSASSFNFETGEW